jgi:hypothetical protein
MNFLRALFETLRKTQGDKAEQVAAWLTPTARVQRAPPTLMKIQLSLRARCASTGD